METPDLSPSLRATIDNAPQLGGAGVPSKVRLGLRGSDGVWRPAGWVNVDDLDPKVLARMRADQAARPPTEAGPFDAVLELGLMPEDEEPPASQ